MSSFANYYARWHSAQWLHAAGEGTVGWALRDAIVDDQLDFARWHSEQQLHAAGEATVGWASRDATLISGLAMPLA
jgi:hypothetical protein